MHAAARDQALGIFFNVVRDKLVDFGSQSNNFGGNIVDEDRAIDATVIEVTKKGFWRAAVGDELFKVGALLLHQFKRSWPEHFVRFDVDVAVSDQVQFPVVRGTSCELRAMSFEQACS